MADQTKNYDEFAHILYNTFYDNHAELQYVKEQFVPLRDWIKNNIPQKLYRFRPITKYSISALETDEIWEARLIHLTIRLSVYHHIINAQYLM